MGRRSHSFWAALCGAALLLCAAGAVRADPIAPAALVPALDVYVDALVAGHGAVNACAPAKSQARDEAAWAKGKAILIASLWAGGFPADFMRTATGRLDAPPPASGKPNCTDPALVGQLGWADQSGWVEVMTEALKGMNLEVIVAPVSPATWTTAKTLIDKDLPDQKRLLDCVAVMYPETLPTEIHDWDEMLGKIAMKLAAAGLPRDEVSAALSPAEANVLWHRAPADAEAELRDSCAKDKMWSNRIADFSMLGLESEIDKLLPTAGSN